ncbi:NAD-dependent epimerase/dehydratase family protein [Pendulispora rubella]|uniref:NAD-dependent epimerase/dehydratase family protein n=1 Tax=Pendulispora rubella TaxID=2741070 RepID=A0ABZ2LJQ9_9BACT
MSKALVTGASGFVGANVARVLAERGRAVRVLVRATSDRRNLQGLDAEIVEGDLRDAEAVTRAVRGCDEVYHVAAEYTFWSNDPASIHRSNVDGTTHVMDACLRAGVGRVVYTSTVGTIGLAPVGGDEMGARDERTPLAEGQLSGHYKRSKFDAEKVVLDYAARGLPVVVVNPSAPVGPWDRKPTPTGQILVDFMLGKMPAFVDTGLNIVHVRDVAEGHVLAAEKGRVGERYILGNENMSLARILETLARLTGKRAPTVRIPYGVAYAAGWLSTTLSDLVTHRTPAIPLESVKMAKRYMFFSSAKAISELGLPQTPVERAFADALDWFSHHHYFIAGGSAAP